jgi:hypothetical protein
MVVMVRAGSALDLGSFDGRYFAVGLELDLATLQYRSSTGTLEADGAGNGVLDLVVNEEGVVAATPAENVVYGVAPDGMLTLLAGGTTLLGGVSPDGAVAAAAGGTTAGSSPRILVLVR